MEREGSAKAASGVPGACSSAVPGGSTKVELTAAVAAPAGVEVGVPPPASEAMTDGMTAESVARDAAMDDEVASCGSGGVAGVPLGAGEAGFAAAGRSASRGRETKGTEGGTAGAVGVAAVSLLRADGGDTERANSSRRVVAWKRAALARATRSQRTDDWCATITFSRTFRLATSPATRRRSARGAERTPRKFRKN